MKLDPSPTRWVVPTRFFGHVIRVSPRNYGQDMHRLIYRLEQDLFPCVTSGKSSWKFHCSTVAHQFEALSMCSTSSHPTNSLRGFRDSEMGSCTPTHPRLCPSSHTNKMGEEQRNEGGTNGQTKTWKPERAGLFPLGLATNERERLPLRTTTNIVVPLFCAYQFPGPSSDVFPRSLTLRTRTIIG